MANNEELEEKENKIYVAAIPDLLNSYNELMKCYTELSKHEKGSYKTDWLQKEAASLKSMVWQLASGEKNE